LQNQHSSFVGSSKLKAGQELHIVVGTDSEEAPREVLESGEGAEAPVPGRSLLHSPAESLQDLR